MKKKIIIISSAICILGACFLSNQSGELSENKAPLVSTRVESVEIPEEIVFAGEKTRLDRYDLYERYDREINSFTYFHATTLMLIKKANRYFPIIEPILEENGVPDDFKYLAVIESLLNPRAVSPAKAAGMWQLLAGTASQFKLEVNDEVDERYSVEKSTQAACKYLNNAYSKYGNWKDVAMSYNAGMGRISGELNKQQVDDSLDLWLVEETSRYYFRMVAIKYIFENPQKYGFILTQNQLYKPIEFNEITINQSIPDLATFAKENGITYAQLKDFNSWLRDRKLTLNMRNQKSYTIQIPKQESIYYKKGEKIKVHNKNWIVK